HGQFATEANDGQPAIQRQLHRFELLAAKNQDDSSGPALYRAANKIVVSITQVVEPQLKEAVVAFVALDSRGRFGGGGYDDRQTVFFTHRVNFLSVDGCIGRRASPPLVPAGPCTARIAATPDEAACPHRVRFARQRRSRL